MVDDEFVRESSTQLRELGDGLIAIEQSPDDRETLDATFRTAHSLKGNCSMAGLDGASALAHAVEDLLAAVRDGSVAPEPELIDEALDATDDIEAILEATVSGRAADVEPAATADALRERLADRRSAPGTHTPEGVSPPGDDDAGDGSEGFDNEVQAALDSASEYDDLDALLAEMDDPEDDPFEGEPAAADGEPVAGDDAGDGRDHSDVAASEPAGESDTAAGADDGLDAVEGFGADDEPGSEPVMPGEDDTAVEGDTFDEIRASVDADEDLEALERDIEAEQFGEFDDDDDMSITDLLEGGDEAAEWDETPAGDAPEAVSETPGDDGWAAAEPTAEDPFGFGVEGDATEGSEAATSPPDDEGFDGSGPFGGSDDDGDVFAEVKAEVDADEDLEALEQDIEAEQFGEFDDDDDMSIAELLEGDDGADWGEDVAAALGSSGAAPADAEPAPEPAGTGPTDVAPASAADVAGGVENVTVEEPEPAEPVLAAGTDDGTPAVTSASASMPTVVDTPTPVSPEPGTPAVGPAEGSMPTVVHVTPAKPAKAGTATPAVTPAEEAASHPSVVEPPAPVTPRGDRTAAVRPAERVPGTPVSDEGSAIHSEIPTPAALAREGDRRAAVVPTPVVADDAPTSTPIPVPAASGDDATPAVTAADGPLTTPVSEAVPTPTSLGGDLTPAVGPAEEPMATVEASSGPEPTDAVVGDDATGADAELDPEVDDLLDVDIPGEEPTDETAEEPAAETAVEETTDPEVDDLLDVDITGEESAVDAESGAFARDTETEAFEDRFGHLFGEEDEHPRTVRRVHTIEESDLDADAFGIERDDEQLGLGDRVESIPVDVGDADELLTLVEQLTTTRFSLERHLGEELPDEVSDALDDLQSVTAGLRRTVMDVRLMPFETATGGLARVARDTAREADKRVVFDVEGRDVGLDRDVIDRLRDPLVHLVRNAVDHGIEPPDEREALGKPAEGRVAVSAERVRDGVVVEVSDDGRGIDTDAVRERLVEEDVLAREAAAALTDEECYNYVFQAGFSTATEVTDVSGRGVGMDVVDSVVRDLEGSVTVDSAPGEGTTVRLELPITIAVGQVMFVRIGDEQYGIPTSAVETVESAGTIEHRDGQPVLPAGVGIAGGAVEADGGDEPYPVIDIGEAFDVPGAVEGTFDAVVRLNADVRRVALRCEEVLDTREVVIKPYEDELGDLPGVSGATLLGEGELVNIIDVTTL